MELVENLQAEGEKFLDKTKKTQQMALIFGGITVVVLILAVVFIFWPSWTNLSEKQASILALEEELAGPLKTQKSDTESQLDDAEKKLTETEKTYGQILPKILPVANDEWEYQDRLNELAVFFEDYSFRYGTKANPFTLDNISFSPPVYENGLYRVSVLMNIKATADGMKAFAEMILKSGSMDKKDFYNYTIPSIPDPQPIPVMTLDTLVVNYKEANTQKSSSSSSSSSSDSEDETKVASSSFSVNFSVFFTATDWMKATYKGDKTPPKDAPKTPPAK
ncbi:MAG: hypothetical protein WCJ84_02120 [Candidatus Peregrinibacteria bacterium]